MTSPLDGIKLSGLAHLPADTGGERQSARPMALEAAGVVADRARQFHGLHGYKRDFPVDRITRDLRIYEASSETRRNIIAGHLLAG